MAETAEKGSPFMYKKCVSLFRKNGRGISSRRVQSLWENGKIDEADVILLSACGELTLLSAKLIENVFWLPEIPAAFCRLRLPDGKNPYRDMIHKLLDYGLLEEARFVSDDKAVGSKLYGISGGVRTWISESDVSLTDFFARGIPSGFDKQIRLIGNLDYTMSLSVLSLNQFHLKMISSYGRRLYVYGRIWVTGHLPANVYRTTMGEWIFTWAPRMVENAGEYFQEEFRVAYSKALSVSSFGATINFLLIVENLEAARRLWKYVPDSEKRGLYFITDRDVFEKTPMAYLIQINGEEEYVRCALEV